MNVQDKKTMMLKINNQRVKKNLRRYAIMNIIYMNIYQYGVPLILAPLLSVE